MQNLDIRLLVSQENLKYVDIAREMGVTKAWLSKLMRFPLSTENRLRILRAVEALKAEGAEE